MHIEQLIVLTSENKLPRSAKTKKTKKLINENKRVFKSSEFIYDSEKKNGR